MKRESTVGQTRFKVWKLTTGEVFIEQCLVEFDSPREEWIRDLDRPWGKQCTHNKVEKATGRTKYSEGGNKQFVFRDKLAAESYAATLGYFRTFYA